MSGQSTPQAGNPDRIRALVTAHRHAQTDHRAALAAEDARGLAAADQRCRAVLDALHRLGAAPIAEQLDVETHAGDGLIVALTCEDPRPDAVDAAIATYLRRRAAVETSTGPTETP